MRALAILGLAGILSACAPGADLVPKPSAVATSAALATPGAPRPLPAALATPSPAKPSVPAEVATVSRVVDGDTIVVNQDGKKQTVRVIGVDTPEVVDRRRPVQCFGREASAKARQLLDGQRVTLIADPTQSSRDKYDRLLRYIERTDGTDFGLWMIANGYAHEYTYEIPYQRQAAYKQAQRQAREKSLGFWSPTACNGDTKRPA